MLVMWTQNVSLPLGIISNKPMVESLQRISDGTETTQQRLDLLSTGESNEFDHWVCSKFG